VRAANQHFDENGVLGQVPPLHHDFEIGEGAHELPVKETDALPAGIVFAPWLIVVAGTFAEGAEDALEIVLVLQTNVLLDSGDAGCLPVFRSVSNVRPSVDVGEASP
jgi:hypothetical protein